MLFKNKHQSYDQLVLVIHQVKKGVNLPVIFGLSEKGKQLANKAQVGLKINQVDLTLQETVY